MSWPMTVRPQMTTVGKENVVMLHVIRSNDMVPKKLNGNYFI